MSKPSVEIQQVDKTFDNFNPRQAKMEEFLKNLRIDLAEILSRKRMTGSEVAATIYKLEQLARSEISISTTCFYSRELLFQLMLFVNSLSDSIEE